MKEIRYDRPSSRWSKRNKLSAHIQEILFTGKCLQMLRISEIAKIPMKECSWASIKRSRREVFSSSLSQTGAISMRIFDLTGFWFDGESPVV